MGMERLPTNGDKLIQGSVSTDGKKIDSNKDTSWIISRILSTLGLTSQRSPIAKHRTKPERESSAPAVRICMRI